MKIIKQRQQFTIWAAHCVKQVTFPRNEIEICEREIFFILFHRAIKYF